MKTEEEASKLWCPFARDTVCGDISEPGPGGSYNRMSGGNVIPDSCRCIASDCMAWNWTGLQVVDAAGNLTAEVVEYFEMYAADCYEPRGDCGLKRRTE